MPLVRIDVLEGNADKLPALGDAVHQALVDAIGVPQDDFFQILASHRSGLLRYDPDYLGVHRDDGIVFVSITLRSGRSVEQKTALCQRIAQLVQQRVGIEPRNVLINLTENEAIDWSFGDGRLQYADSATRPAKTQPAK